MIWDAIASCSSCERDATQSCSYNSARCWLAIVRAGAVAGTITVRASAAGLKGGEATIMVK
jgi:hypothetical protein